VIIELNGIVIILGFTSVILVSIITTFLLSYKIQKTVFKSVSKRFYGEQSHRGKIKKGMKKTIIQDISTNSPIASIITSFLPESKQYLIENPDAIEDALEYVDLIQKRFPDLTDKVTSLLANVGGDKLKKPIDVSPNYPYSHKEIT
jgi:hypothetical protein